MMLGVQSAFSRQATAFETVGNIYAPYYRQADAAARATLPQAEQVAIVDGAPTQDGIAAFANLLSQYMKDHPVVYQRMVVAYVVGYSITPEYLARNPQLKFAQGADDTGVIASWNTEAPTVGGTNPVLLPGGLVINPITWTRTETEATAAQNLGAIALNKNGTAVLDASGNIDPVLNFADARIDLARGVVICSTVPVDVFSPGNALFPKGVYHTIDYPFYFFDVRANAANRVAHYLGTK